MKVVNPYDLMETLNNFQKQAKEIQEKLKTVSCEGSSGLDMIKVTMSGDFKVTDIKIDPKILAAGTPDMLEVLLASAVNAASDKVKDKIKEETQNSTGLNIPGMSF